MSAAEIVSKDFFFAEKIIFLVFISILFLYLLYVGRIRANG